MCVCVCLDRAQTSDIEMLGHWNKTNMQMSYLRKTPHEPLLVAAGFTTSPNSYNLPRSRVIPPTCLSDLVLPWVATDVEAVEGINRLNKKNIKDEAAKNFLDCLMWLKIVYLQDMALLQGVYPNLPVFKAHLVFQHPEWSIFSRQVKAAADAHEVNKFID